MPSYPDPRNGPIGILGGTFDPVHYGHLRAAVEVREMLGLSEVRMLPAARPPHRETPAAAPEHRFEMLRLATAAEEFLLPDDSEMRREGPSWMVDTLSGFRARCGAQPLVLIIGQDAANGLDGWREWRRLFELAHIAVMCRPGSAPANPSVVSVTLGGSAQLGLGYSCSKFDPVAAVTHTLNDIGAGVDNMMNAMTAAASAAIAALSQVNGGWPRCRPIRFRMFWESSAISSTRWRSAGMCRAMTFSNRVTTNSRSPNANAASVLGLSNS